VHPPANVDQSVTNRRTSGCFGVNVTVSEGFDGTVTGEPQKAGTVQNNRLLDGKKARDLNEAVSA